MSISVFLCDDVADMRMLLRLTMEADPELEVVGEAENGEDAVREIARLKPDVVVLDLSMPKLDGLEAIPLIKEVSPDTEIVVFSGYSAERMAALALDLKAARYIQKGRDLDELRALVREVAAA